MTRLGKIKLAATVGMAASAGSVLVGGMAQSFWGAFLFGIVAGYCWRHIVSLRGVFQEKQDV